MFQTCSCYNLKCHPGSFVWQPDASLGGVASASHALSSWAIIPRALYACPSLGMCGGLNWCPALARFHTPNTSHCSKHQGVSCTCLWFPCSNSYGATFKWQEQSYNRTSLLPWGKTVRFDKRLSECSSVWDPPRLLFCYILPVSLWGGLASCWG